MKKVLAIILTGLLILPVLSGCTKVPDWAKKNDIYKETYIALAEEFKKPAEKSDNAREYIRTHDIDQERKERRGTTTSSTTRKPSTGSSIWGNGSSGSSSSGGSTSGGSSSGSSSSNGSSSGGSTSINTTAASSVSGGTVTAEPVKFTFFPRFLTRRWNNNRSKKIDKTPDVSVFLKYDETAEMPYFDFTNIDHVDIVRAATALTEVWDGKDIPMFGAKSVAYRNDAWMLEFFKTFKCKSIKLQLPELYASSREKLRNSTTTYDYPSYSVGDIENLTTLYVDRTLYRLSTSSSIKTCESLTELKVPSTVTSLPISTKFPKLKKLIFRYNGYSVPGEEMIKSIKGSSVEEVDFYSSSGNDPTPSLRLYDFFSALKKIKTIKKINGKDRETFVIPMNETTEKELKERTLREKKEAAAKTVKEKCRKLVNKYATSSEEGTPKLGKKILVDLAGINAIDYALKGQDFRGIPNKRLARNYKEANTLLILYPAHKKIGYYTNGGGAANRTYSMVITVDLKTKTRASHLVGTTEPPQRITFRRGFGTGASGAFMTDKALKYAKSLL